MKSYADCSFCSEMRMGRSLLRITSRVMMHSFSAGSEGSSYIDVEHELLEDRAQAARAGVPLHRLAGHRGARPRR